MNKFSQGLVVALGSIGLGLSQAAQAVENLTPVTSTATIDWSKLQLSVTGVTATVPTVVFSNYNTSLSSSSTSAGGNESHSVTRNDWTSTRPFMAGSRSTSRMRFSRRERKRRRQA